VQQFTSVRQRRHDLQDAMAKLDSAGGVVFPNRVVFWIRFASHCSTSSGLGTRSSATCSPSGTGASGVLWAPVCSRGFADAPRRAISRCKSPPKSRWLMEHRSPNFIMHTPNTRRGLSALVVVAAMAAALPAQTTGAIRTAEGPLEPQVVPIHTAEAWNGHSYGIWAAGSTYKASFHDGMTFVPYLGDHSPHNQPFSWRTESVTIGDVQLVTQHPVFDHADYRAEFDHGRVVEAYDVHANGLEQTFVIRAAPTTGDLTTGDLVV